MSNIIRNYAKTVKVGNAIAKQVFLELADTADIYGCADETVEQLAQTLELSEISIKRALQFLEGRKLIRRHALPKQKGHWIRKITYIVLPNSIKQKLTNSLIAQGYKPSICEIPSEAEPSICEIRGEAENNPTGYLIDSQPGISQTEYLTDTFHIEYGDKEDVILNEEVNKEISLDGREEVFWQIVMDGLKERLNTPITLPNEFDWKQSVEWAFINQFEPNQCLEVYDLLEKIRKKKKQTWRVTAEIWQNNIPRIETLKSELEDLENGTNQNGKQPGNYRNGNGKTPKPDNPRTDEETLARLGISP